MQLVEELEANLAKSLVTFLSVSQILFLILYHGLPTGKENTVISHCCSSSSWKSWRPNLAKSLVTFLSLSDSLPHPVL
jgi:hypothetical protein